MLTTFHVASCSSLYVVNYALFYFQVIKVVLKKLSQKITENSHNNKNLGIPNCRIAGLDLAQSVFNFLMELA